MKKFLAVGLSLTITLFCFLPEALAMTKFGKYQRFVTSDMVKEMQRLPGQRTFVIERGASGEEKQKALRTMDTMMSSLKSRGGRPGLTQAVKLWESMSSQEKQRALSGPTQVADAVAIVGLVVAAAALGWMVGKDVAEAGKDVHLGQVTLNRSSLDFTRDLDPETFGGRHSVPVTTEAQLDYAY